MINSYIYMRKALNASSMQDSDQAVSLWNRAQELDGTFSRIIDWFKVRDMAYISD